MSGLPGLDRALFVFLNGRWHTPWLDRFFPFITDLENFHLYLVAVWVALVLFGGARGRRAAFLVALALAATDMAVNDLVKPWVGRMRPCLVVPEARVLVDFARSLSFPSSHAGNICAAMSVMSFFYRRWSPLFILVALLVSYSRIYVGVHYPLDVLAGAIIGLAIAAGMVAAGPAIESGLGALGDRWRRGPRRVV